MQHHWLLLHFSYKEYAINIYFSHWVVSATTTKSKLSYLILTFLQFEQADYLPWQLKKAALHPKTLWSWGIHYVNYIKMRKNSDFCAYYHCCTIAILYWWRLCKKRNICKCKQFFIYLYHCMKFPMSFGFKFIRYYPDHEFVMSDVY